MRFATAVHSCANTIGQQQTTDQQEQQSSPHAQTCDDHWLVVKLSDVAARDVIGRVSVSVMAMQQQIKIARLPEREFGGPDSHKSAERDCHHRRAARMFPKSAPFQTHSIRRETQDLGGEPTIHALSVREYGTRTGVPIVYLHGGPGGATPPDLPRLFDPEIWRVVCFDQRGCGQSTCSDRLKGNTTDDLLSDIEAIRCSLGIDRWAVMGSSYGSFLAALYAARQPGTVSFVLLHGVFMGSRAEIKWLFDEKGAANFYPQQLADLDAEARKWSSDESGLECKWFPLEATQKLPLFHDHDGDHLMVVDGIPFKIPSQEWMRKRPLTAYHYALTGSLHYKDAHDVPRCHPSPDVAQNVLSAAAALTKYEDEMETLVPIEAKHDDPSDLLAGAQIAVHHFMNGCFVCDRGALPELRNAEETLKAIPCAIVHGRHDVICPVGTAYAVHKAWPGSQLRIVEMGAHALFEKPMRTAAQACLLALRTGAGSSAEEEGGGGGRAKRKR